MLSSFFSFIKSFFRKKEKEQKEPQKTPTTKDLSKSPSSKKPKSPETTEVDKSSIKEKVEVKRKKVINDKLPTFKNLKALIVEDNLTNQKMIKYTLKNIGIECDMAENGRVGVDMRIKNNYDIIFMDIQMPIMNGVEATKAILEYEKENNISHIPIVAVTANALKGDREKFLDEGMDEYISKPIDFNRLVDVLVKFCSSKQLSSDSKDILLYKNTQTEAKIVSAILQKLGYSVDVAKSIEEFKKGIDFNNYSSVIIDRIQSDIIHQDITKKIKSKNIPSLLFIDKQIKLIPSDKETYTHITDKLTDFKLIQEKVSSMMRL
jgi:CheY-like chemotaxis protein